MHKYLLLIAMFICVQLSHSQEICGNRYLNDIFDKVKFSGDYSYGENINAEGQLQQLKFDVYEPVGDTSKHRAVFIFIHGGAYWSGNENIAESSLLGYNLARKGYVVICPNYRKEPSIVSLLSGENMVKAVARGNQDAKAIVRYLDKDILEGGNTFGLDREKVFIGGASAGAISSLHLAYLDAADSLQPNWKEWMDEVGGLEGNSGTPGYSYRVAGIVNINGALGDADFMNNGAKIPFVSVHNIWDPQIPFERGHPYDLPMLPVIEGSKLLHEKAVERGIYNPFYIIPTHDHTSYEDGGEAVQPYFDSTIYYLVHFFRNVMGCEDDFANFQQPNAGKLMLFPNPAVDEVVLASGDRSMNDVYDISICNNAGQTVFSDEKIILPYRLDIRFLPKGNFHIFLEKNGKIQASEQLRKE